MCRLCLFWQALLLSLRDEPALSVARESPSQNPLDFSSLSLDSSESTKKKDRLDSTSSFSPVADNAGSAGSDIVRHYGWKERRKRLWQAYARALPDTCPSHLWSFAPDQLAELKASHVLELFAEFDLNYRTDYARICKCFPALGAFGETRWLWARITVASRQFQLTMPEMEEPVCALVPLADLLNHSSDNNMNWEFVASEAACDVTLAHDLPRPLPAAGASCAVLGNNDVPTRENAPTLLTSSSSSLPALSSNLGGGCFRLSAACDIFSGQALTASYGRSRSNADCLLFYGFASPDNALHDVCKLVVPPFPGERTCLSKLAGDEVKTFARAEQVRKQLLSANWRTGRSFFVPPLLTHKVCCFCCCCC
jgi:hypothetical protein